MLTLLDEDEVGTCKDEHAEHENIAAGVRWHDIKGRSGRRRGANANKTIFHLFSHNGLRCHQSECFIFSDDVKTGFGTDHFSD